VDSKVVSVCLSYGERAEEIFGGKLTNS
jgi:hypothetical protein